MAYLFYKHVGLGVGGKPRTFFRALGVRDNFHESGTPPKWVCLVKDRGWTAQGQRV